MAGFILLRLFLAFVVLPVALVVMGWNFFKRDPSEIKIGSTVLVNNGQEGKVIEIAHYEDMTLYGVRLGNEVIHFERTDLIKRM